MMRIQTHAWVLSRKIPEPYRATMWTTKLWFYSELGRVKMLARAKFYKTKREALEARRNLIHRWTLHRIDVILETRRT